MVKQYFSDRKQEFTYTIIVTVLFTFAYMFMFYPRFQGDLDILMQSSIYGISGVSSSYILFSNILLGKILTVFVSILPGVPWYLVFHYALICISLFVITYIIVKRNKSVTGKVLAAVTVAFIGYECYVDPNYMKTSVLLCVCAAYWLLDAYETNAKSKLIGVVLLALLSSMICFSAFVVSAIIGFGIVCGYCLFKKCNKTWMIAIAATVASVVVLAAGAKMFDTAMYTRNQRERDLSYRDSMEKLFGYGVPEYSEDMLRKYGLDDVHYKSISQGLFFSNGDETLELLKEILEEKQMVSWDAFTKYFRTVPISLFQTGMAYYLVVLCVVFLIARCDKRIVIATIGILLGEYFVFYLFHAWEYEWISFIVMLPVSLLLLIAIKNVVIKESSTLIAYVLALGVILYLNFNSTMVTSVREESTAELLVQTEAEGIYLVDMIEYLRKGSVFEVYDRVAIPENVFLMNGAYGLMDGFSTYVRLGVPAEDVEYNRLYNPSKVSVKSLFLEAAE